MDLDICGTSMDAIAEEFLTLSTLEEKAGRDAIVGLLDSYLINAEETFSRLLQIRANDDFPGAELISHRMSGATGSFGFKRLSALYQKLHEAAQAADAQKVSDLIDQVEDHNGQIATEIHIRYPETGSP
jgi:HPt (histidine-containing phosphotransfer) domain-containing protein